MRRFLSATALGIVLNLPVLAFAPITEEVTVTHGGLNLNASLETVGGDWQQGPVVLIVHGTLAHSHRKIIESLQLLLKERGVSSLAITLSLGRDNRQGMYDCTAPHTHKHTDAVEEIGVWLGWLQSQGVAQVALLGHSRGGNQVALFAAGHPEAPLPAVILLGPLTWSDDYAAADYQKRFGTDLAPQLEAARRIQAEGKGGELMAPVDFLYCADTSVTADAFLSYYAPNSRLDTPALIPEIQAPVLVIAGSEDNIVPGLLEKVQPQSDGERVTLRVLDGADHFFRDFYLLEVADAVAVAAGSGRT